jgi:hypothetical protein
MSNHRINTTGIRDGETITSAPGSKQNKGTVMKIRLEGEIYKPAQKFVSQLSDTDVRDVFNQFSFFKNMTFQERKDYLSENQIVKSDVYLEEANLSVKFIKIGGEFFVNSLSQEQIDNLLTGNPEDPEGYWNIVDIYNMFPRKPGSKARKHTLIFRPSNWILMEPEIKDNNYTGVYISLSPTTLAQGSLSGKGILIHKLENDGKNLLQSLAVVEPTGVPIISIEQCFNLLSAHYDISLSLEIKSLLDWFTPGIHKSLIQKLIRTRCPFVSQNGKQYEGRQVLLVSFSMLLIHTGSFVPNIQRFVGGLESAAKRMAVSLCEDSYIDKSVMMEMYACALLAQNNREWKLTEELFSSWIVPISLAQQDKRMFEYDFHNFKGGITKIDELSMSYFLLDELRSFKNDINMVGSIAVNEGRSKTETDLLDVCHNMDLYHCIDHHSLPELVWYLTSSGDSYSKVFNKIWNKVTGVNPRLSKFTDHYKIMNDDHFVKDVKKAQNLLWLSRTVVQTHRVVKEEEYTFKYSLDVSTLSGLLGPIETKVGNVSVLVVLSPKDIHEMIPVKRPSRDKTSETDLTEQEKVMAIENVKRSLESGIVLPNISDTLSSLKGSKLFLQDDRYIIALTSGDVFLWEDYIHQEYIFKTHPPIELNLENSIRNTGTGVQEGADYILEYIFENTNLSILRRLSTYLEGYHSIINLFKVGRDGEGVDYKVFPEDTGCFLLLCYVCCLFPACLNYTIKGFVVKSGPLLWNIRDKLEERLRKNVLTFPKGWSSLEDDSRRMWEHQHDAINTMIKRNKTGKRGHIIWIPVGMGKTLIVIKYIIYLIKNNKMPEYCVYSLPPSAVESIKKEFDFFKISYREIDMRLAGVNRELSKFSVNLVLHDHMRMNGLDEQMRDKSNNMIFILDEFHKTLNKTQRTSISLEMSKLSVDFVAMSGTIIKDSNPVDLIRWLEQIVEFEVNEKNYWVAIGALVSNKVQTHVLVDRNVIDIEMSELERNKYYSLVPKGLGGTSDKINFHEALSVCYNIIKKHMVDLSITYIEAGEKVFLVAKDIETQKQLSEMFISRGVTKIFLIGKDNSLNYAQDDMRDFQVVITTPGYSMGYTLTKIRIMITSVYFGNQATREQLEGRLNRIGQISPEIRIITLHTGILSYIFKRYENARSVSEVMKGFAKTIDM